VSKIAIVLPDLRGGGVERIRLVLAREFARAGHKVEFVLMRAQGELLSEAETAFSVIDLKVDRIRRTPLALARYLRQSRPDALLVAMWPLTGLASISKRLSGVSTKLVVSEHVDFGVTPSIKTIERHVLRHFGRLLYGPADAIIAVSTGVSLSLEAVAGIPIERIKVIHNPVRPWKPGPLSVEDQELVSWWTSGDAALIAIGNLKKQKAFDVTLRALQHVRRHIDARLIVLGEGELRSDLARLAEELGLSKAISLPGFRSNPRSFLEVADLFVLSSAWEGFGNVIVEALSAGVPVVSTDCRSGPREILEEGRWGCLVPVGDSEELSRGILETLQRHPPEHDLIARSRTFSPELQARLYLECFGL
jgi:glycosyltransferase involved in cell wall biosynthesis